jgi:hypothetical protein
MAAFSLPAGEALRIRSGGGLALVFRPDGRVWEIEIVWRRDPWWQRWIRAWREDRQARLLAPLDPRILEDIGLGPESTNPRNVPLYERHGFERLGTIQSGSSPPLFPMLRRPRARVLSLDSARAVDPDRIRAIVAVAEADRRKAMRELMRSLWLAARRALVSASRLLQMQRVRRPR